MRIVWLVFVVLIAAMAVVLPRLGHQAAAPTATPAAPATLPITRTALRQPAVPGQAARADSIVAFGLAQQGTPYVWAGTSPLTGFDCSGFILYTFAHFGVAVPHSTALLIDVGRPVARTEAQPGDIVVFTGTAATSTTPGHAGIVISRRGELPLRFVHASSSRREPFVKVSQVEETDYERRFMQVRRVLGPGEVATSRPKLPVPARMGATVAALPVRPVAVEPVAAPAAPLPIKLARRKLASASHSTAKKKPVAKKAAAKVTTAKKKASPSAKRKTSAKAARTAPKKHAAR
jgi:hypothetical protein